MQDISNKMKSPNPFDLHPELEIKKHVKPSLKLIMHIGPLGLEHTEISLTNRENIDPYSYTKGEGQCLIFDLIDFDTSNEFSKALHNGDFLKYYGNYFHKVQMIEKKIK